MAIPERIRADAVAAITGLSTRAVQSLALRGIIPGAARLGRRWTFDEEKVWRDGKSA